jgi:hypothetical protein
MSQIEVCPYCGSINDVEVGSCCICVPQYVNTHEEHIKWQNMTSTEVETLEGDE